MMARCSRSSPARSARPSTCPPKPRRRDHADLHRGLEAGPQGGGDLPRRLQAQPAGEHRQASEAKKPKPRSRRSARVPGSGNGSKARPFRRRMPATRRSITHKFDIAGHEGYLTVGCTRTARRASCSSPWPRRAARSAALMDAFGTAISLCLQYGVPVVKTLPRNSPTAASSRADSPRIRTSRSPSRSWITSSAGWPDLPYRCVT
jgi:hypothetical protein